MLKFLGFIAIFALTIPVSLLHGFVLKDLLDWFFNLHISIIQGVGLSMIVGMFTYSLKRSTETKPDAEWYVVPLSILFGSVMYSLVAWALGAIWSMFL